MIRTTLLALLLAITTAIAPVEGHAQTHMVCNGQFERLLRGYWIGWEELTPFLADDAAVAACTSQLDDTVLDHLVVKAYISENSRGGNQALAKAMFDAACVRGSRVACYYGAAYPPGATKVVQDAAAIARIAQFLDDDNLTAAKTTTANALLTGMDGIKKDRERAFNLLHQASQRGDYWASYTLALQIAATRDFPEREAAALRWANRAADQGHVPALRDLAVLAAQKNSWPAAIEFYRRAASADGRFFRQYVASARFAMAESLRDGMHQPRDTAEARYWFEQAGALGHPGAAAEIKKLK